MRIWARQMERFSVFLGLVVIGLAGLSFLTSHQVTQRFEHRFLFSSAMLACSALFLRFLLRRKSALDQAAYRIASTMAFWSLGLFVFPYPEAILYLVALPALFFLWRAEVKSADERGPDVAAAGILLGLCAFLYAQQQPLQVLLFPEATFVWRDYYTNAPVMILTGLGFMRLHRSVDWSGLALLGSLALVLGCTLTASMILPLPVFTEFAMLAVFSHAMLACLFIRNPVYDHLVRFAGLRQEERGLYKLQMFWLLNMALQAGLSYLLFHPTDHYWVLALLVVCVAGGLYHFRRITVSVAMLETALIVFPFCVLFYPGIYADVFTAILAALLLACVRLRRSPGLEVYAPNGTFAVLALIYLVHLALMSLFTPLGLLRFLVFFLCWVALPDRPFAPARRNQLLIWPPLAALIVLCVNRGFDPWLVPVWSLSCLIPPLLLLVVLRSEIFKNYAIERQWLFTRDWRAAGERCMYVLVFLAVGGTALAFPFDLGRFASGWTAVIQSVVVLAVSCGILFTYAVRRQRVMTAFCAEVLAWMLLLLLRWKVAQLGRLDWGAPLDGYLLMMAGGLVSGLRELLATRAPAFTRYFASTAQIYTLLGWAYILYLQFQNGGAHGELSSLLMVCFYVWLARTGSRANVIAACLFANITLALFFFNRELDHVLFYLIPALGSVLVLVQLYREDLGERTATLIRVTCSLVLLGTTAIYNIVDFSGSIWYPVTAAACALVGVILGVLLRVRAFLLLGLAFFAVNGVATIVQVVIRQPPERTNLILGLSSLVSGLLFIGGFYFFQVRRKLILERLREVKGKLENWQ